MENITVRIKSDQLPGTKGAKRVTAPISALVSEFLVLVMKEFGISPHAKLSLISMSPKHKILDSNKSLEEEGIRNNSLLKLAPSKAKGGI